MAGLTPVTFTATAKAAVPASLAVVSGDGQRAPVLTPLAQPLSVAVRDKYGNPYVGATVQFQVAAGNGELMSYAPVANSDGVASVRWLLGSALGTQTATAKVGALAPVTFTATATPPPYIATAAAGTGSARRS